MYVVVLGVIGVEKKQQCMMTHGTTTSLAASTMHLEKSSEMSVDRRH